MSESNSPANEPGTTEEPTENNAGSESLSFEEIQSLDKRLKAKRKTIEIAIPDPDNPETVAGVAEFEYRMLSEDEKDEAEDAAVNIETKRNKEEISTDSGALRATLIKHGVTSGPEGFKLNNERYARELPSYLKEPLAEAIENFSEMPEEDRAGFP
jgi:hypothetical protein